MESKFEKIWRGWSRMRQADTMKSVGFLHFSLIKIIFELAPGSRLGWMCYLSLPSSTSTVLFRSSTVHTDTGTKFYMDWLVFQYFSNIWLFCKSQSQINQVVVSCFSLILIHSMTHLSVRWLTEKMLLQ